MTKRNELIEIVTKALMLPLGFQHKPGISEKAVDAILAVCPELGEPVHGFDERELTRAIDQRDAADDAVNSMYLAVMGKPPEWSNCFLYKDAIEEVFDAFTAGQTQAGKVVVNDLVWGDKVVYDITRPPHIYKGWSIHAKPSYDINYFADTETYLVQSKGHVLAEAVNDEAEAQSIAQAHHDKQVWSQIEVV